MTKQELIKIIQSLPDCLNIELSNEVPVPYETTYHMGYSSRPTSTKMNEEYGHIPDGFLLNPEEVEQLRKQKHEITEYAKQKLRKMTEDAAKKEEANELYQDALNELDNLAAGVDSEDFMNAYLVIQSALKVALGEEDV
jgi:hypothetical protein